jgi:two-component system, NtrC family, nitrogen regulation sensor histidine kinase NtrY
VSLRARFVLYLVAVHALMALVAAVLVARNRWWLLVAEAVILASFLAGLALVRRFLRSIEFVRESAQLLEDSDFMSRVREVSQPDLDRLIQVYNRMVDALRGERVRLQEQQHFLSLVLRESPAGIVVLDFDGRVTLANPAAGRLLQAEPHRIVGQPLHAMERAFARELLALSAGERRMLSVWGGRRVRALHGTFPDRGFRRSFYLMEELTEELRHSEKSAYEKLIRMLSHEVNNTVGASNSLLTSCLTYAGQLRPGDRADFEHALGVVIARTEQLSAFMGSFADVVRLPPPRLAPVDPAELVDGLLDLVRAQAEARRIAVQRTGPRRLGGVPLDRGQIEQALLNVIKNALEAIGTDGTLTVRVAGDGGVPLIEIEDSGPGLSDEVVAHLFTPFFSTKDGGQGIGLTMVQEILGAHGFPFALEGPRGGPTVFTVRLAPQAPSAR